MYRSKAQFLSVLNFNFIRGIADACERERKRTERRNAFLTVCRDFWRAEFCDTGDSAWRKESARAEELHWKCEARLSDLRNGRAKVRCRCSYRQPLAI
jgi:hypothetical protein